MYNVKGTYIFPKTQVLEKAIKEISWSVKTENPKTKKLGNHGKLLFIFSLNCLTVSLYSSTSTSNDTLKKLHRKKKDRIQSNPPRLQRKNTQLSMDYLFHGFSLFSGVH